MIDAIIRIKPVEDQTYQREFVENEQILEMLEQYDVNYAQGYYIGKLLPDILRDYVA
ncbi:MAG: hypothetical protein GY694_13065 [Gammaproteobacteria bacterium]|nr:hypothetical protein [Gammaproteobacteria bacterium]